MGSDEVITSVEDLPGTFILGARTKEGLTQAQLAEKIGVTQGHISEMERGAYHRESYGP